MNVKSYYKIMEQKIYQILKKHKLPIKKREELVVDLLALLNTSNPLLEKYMAHVIDCEGIDYVSYIGGHMSDQKFTSDEKAFLQKLSDNINKNYNHE